jgi:hypothetical protein
MSMTTCQVHIIGPDGPPTTETWEVGEDIPESAYESSKDDAGEIYAMYHYEAGKKKWRTIPKSIFEKVKSDFGY